MEKYKILVQTLNPDAIGGTSTAYRRLINSKLSEKFEFSKYISNKTVLSLKEFISLINYFRKENVHLVDIQGVNIEVFQIILAAKIAGKKIVMSIHGLYSDFHEINIIKKALCMFITEPVSIFLVDGVYTVCGFAANRKRIRIPARNFLGFNYNAAPDYSIYDKEDINKKFRKEHNIGMDYIIALYVGRITYDKGATILASSLLELNNHWPEKFVFIFVGDGRSRNLIEKQLNPLIVNHQVIFTGKTEEVYKYYMGSNFLVSTSLHENNSLTILEASAAGLPCLVTEVGGNPEIVYAGYNGLLIKPLDVKDTVRGIEEMIDNKNRWIDWGKNSQKLMKDKFNEDEIYDKLSAFYLSLIEKD